jgi:hypothetical protein
MTSNIVNKLNYYHENLIPMQKTGIPVIPLFMGLIILMGGFIVTKKK